MKGTYEKSIVNIPTSEILNASLLKWATRKAYPLHHFSSTLYYGVPEWLSWLNI